MLEGKSDDDGSNEFFLTESFMCGEVVSFGAVGSLFITVNTY